MILASAQTEPKLGDINGNLNDHYRLIKLASDKGVNVVAFPEMSITGYVHESANSLAFTENDSRLAKLRKLAVDNKIIVVAGAPLKVNTNLYICSFVIYPDNSISIYTKQFLYRGEEKFFSSSFDYNPVIEVDNEKISLAICFDIENPLHPENACKVRSTIYITSIFYSPEGISGAHNLLGSYAKKYKMNILMSNYSGRTQELKAGGKSAFWTNNGDLITSLETDDSGLLMIEKINNNWTRKK
jgi:predicted amidohydrolase